MFVLRWCLWWCWTQRLWLFNRRTLWWVLCTLLRFGAVMIFQNMSVWSWRSENLPSVIAYGLVFSRLVNSVFCDQRTRFQWQRYTRPNSPQVSVTLTTVHLSASHLTAVKSANGGSLSNLPFEYVFLLSGDQTATKKKVRPGTHSIWWKMTFSHYLLSPPYRKLVLVSQPTKENTKRRQTS